VASGRPPVLGRPGRGRMTPPVSGLAAARAVVAGGPPGAARDRILAFLDAHPAALTRSCAAGHLTGSAAVLDPAGSAVLLVAHRKLGRWLQPGGHADGDPDLAAVALGEAAEETGVTGLAVVGGPVDLDVHEVPGDATGGTHLHLDVRYLVVAPAGAEPRPSARETAGAAWFPVHALPPGADGSLHRLVAAAVAALAAHTSSGVSQSGMSL
jgi:8-oxo-dGTP pyrophosphatase MutT (NUDIX family)